MYVVEKFKLQNDKYFILARHFLNHFKTASYCQWIWLKLQFRTKGKTFPPYFDILN